MRRISIVLVILAGCGVESEEPVSVVNEAPAEPLPAHRVARDESKDRSIIRYVVLEEETDVEGATRLLNDLYSGAKREMANRVDPTIAIFLFATPEHLETDPSLWAALKIKDPTFKEPEIRWGIPLRVVMTGEERGGRSEAERREIWGNIAPAFFKAMIDSRKQYPEPVPTDKQRAAHDHRMELMSRDAERVRGWYKLSPAELEAIIAEGVEKGWPPPKTN